MFEIIEVIIVILLGFLPFIILYKCGILKPAKKYGIKILKSDKIVEKNIPYNRSIDSNENIFRVYYIAYNYDIVKKRNDIVGAILVKWAKDGVIRIKKRFDGKNERCIIILKGNRIKTFKDKREMVLYNMIYEASNDGILEDKEFEQWSRKKYNNVIEWIDNISKEERDKLVKEKLIKVEKGIFEDKYVSTKELKAKALKLIGLKNYLTNYTLMKERQAEEVIVFEDYLIYAKLLGIAKQLSKQFKELYPEMLDLENYETYDRILNEKISIFNK